MKNLIILSIPLMFSGCYSNIDLDHYKNDKIENMVVLNSLMNPDSMITVIATHPYFSEQFLLFRYLSPTG